MKPAMRWVNAPICERCWVLSQFVSHMVGDEVTTYMVQHTALNIPVRMVKREPEHETETCFECGWPTWCGIYVRRQVAPSHPLYEQD